MIADRIVRIIDIFLMNKNPTKKKKKRGLDPIRVLSKTRCVIMQTKAKIFDSP